MQRREQGALQVHLASPNTVSPIPGKVYIAYLACKLKGEGGSQAVKSSYCELMPVDPWELLVAPGARAKSEGAGSPAAGVAA